LADYADDLLAAQQCAQDAIDKFRTNINNETTAVFQSEISTCINDLIDKTTNLYCDAFIDGVSVFNSEFSIDFSVQFTTRAIIITVILKDSGGTNIMNDIPEECLDDILDKLRAEATFGSVSDFVYGRTNAVITANITSEAEGSGELKMLFDGQVFSTLVEGVEFDTPSSIVEKSLPYEFVDAVGQPAVRRDATDVSGDE